jgi:hypothetical protein
MRVHIQTSRTRISDCDVASVERASHARVGSEQSQRFQRYMHGSLLVFFSQKREKQSVLPSRHISVDNMAPISSDQQFECKTIDGTVIRGRFYAVDGKGPAIIMTPGVLTPLTLLFPRELQAYVS